MLSSTSGPFGVLLSILHPAFEHFLDLQVDRLRVDGTQDKKMAKGHLPRVLYHQVNPNTTQGPRTALGARGGRHPNLVAERHRLIFDRIFDRQNSFLTRKIGISGRQNSFCDRQN